VNRGEVVGGLTPVASRKVRASARLFDKKEFKQRIIVKFGNAQTSGWKMNGKRIKQTLLLTCLVLIVSLNQVYAKCTDRRAPGVDWSGCKKTNKMLDDSNFNGARLVKTNMSLSSATNSQFNNSDLTKAAGYRADFDQVTLQNSIMTKSEFSRATFRDATISDVDWSKAELGRVDFSGAELKNVSFVYSNISRVRFANAKLKDVDFWRAYTYRTRFEDVDLSQVQRLSQLQLEIACGNANTRLPEDRLMPDNWPCEE